MQKIKLCVVFQVAQDSATSQNFTVLEKAALSVLSRMDAMAAEMEYVFFEHSN